MRQTREGDRRPQTEAGTNQRQRVKDHGIQGRRGHRPGDEDTAGLQKRRRHYSPDPKSWAGPSTDNRDPPPPRLLREAADQKDKDRRTRTEGQDASNAARGRRGTAFERTAPCRLATLHRHRALRVDHRCPQAVPRPRVTHRQRHGPRPPTGSATPERHPMPRQAENVLASEGKGKTFHGIDALLTVSGRSWRRGRQCPGREGRVPAEAARQEAASSRRPSLTDAPSRVSAAMTVGSEVRADSAHGTAA